jgi:putative transposase
MLRNRCLARHVAWVGMGEFRRQVEYKTGWVGGTVQVVDRWYPSPKTCSGCGVVKTKLGLSDRVFRCDECPLVFDRDFNAAAISPHWWTRLRVAGLPRVAGRPETSPRETHVRPARCGQRVLPREDPDPVRAKAVTAR